MNHKTIRRYTPLLKRLLFVAIAATLFYQWVSFSLNYGIHPYKNGHESSFDHLFHKDSSKLKLEIEQILKGNSDDKPPPSRPKVDYSIKKRANLTLDLTRLETKFGEDWHWLWIAMRVKQQWSELCDAILQLHVDYPKALHNRTSLRILVMPGVLTQTDFAHPERAFHGGPVGELTQWADLIAVLYLLDHELELRWDIRYVGIDLGLQYNEEGSSWEAGCASTKYDVIYTDLGGHINLPAHIRDKYRLKFRVLDAFGTEVMYNVEEYARRHGIDRGAGLRNLNVKQFFTMYPEVSDNSFAGFIISKKMQVNNTKENIGILYGKQVNYLRGRRKFISSLRKFMELHATIPNAKGLDNDLVINHGVLSRSEYSDIVNKAKYFIGLGDPIEGPGMLEAVARGCIIIQPRFKHGVKLNGKPNNRTITSQVPYLERIGAPHVYTIDYDNMTEVINVISSIQQSQVSPLLPVEFSAYGYIQRLNTYLEKQVYCGQMPRWPPDSQLRVKLAAMPDQPCSKVCEMHDMMCETALFDLVNSTQIFANLHLNCQTSKLLSDVYAPAYIENTHTCLFQNDSRLYSCASYNVDNVFRVCPCMSKRKAEEVSIQ